MIGHIARSMQRKGPVTYDPDVGYVSTGEDACLGDYLDLIFAELNFELMFS